MWKYIVKLRPHLPGDNELLRQYIVGPLSQITQRKHAVQTSPRRNNLGIASNNDLENVIICLIQIWLCKIDPPYIVFHLLVWWD